MKLLCPKCGSRFSLDQAVDTLMQKEVQNIAAKLGQNWQLTFEYTDCFRQKEYGDIMPKTRWRLLREIEPLFETGVFQNRGKRFRTHEHELVKAMRSMCNRNIWGVKSHGYLTAILMKTADRLSAEGLTAREEQGREEERRHRAAPAESTGSALHYDRSSTGQAPEQLRKLPFKDIANNLGKGEKP